jgi:hypothetical protein
MRTALKFANQQIGREEMAREGQATARANRASCSSILSQSEFPPAAAKQHRTKNSDEGEGEDDAQKWAHYLQDASPALVCADKLEFTRGSRELLAAGRQGDRREDMAS